jgi:hypothetical protein
MSVRLAGPSRTTRAPQPGDGRLPRRQPPRQPQAEEQTGRQRQHPQPPARPRFRGRRGRVVGGLEGALARALGAHFEVQVGVQAGVADEVAARIRVGAQGVFQLLRAGLVEQAVQVIVDQVAQRFGYVHEFHPGRVSRAIVRSMHSKRARRMRRKEL